MGFFSSKDNTKIIQAVFDRDILLVSQLIPHSDLAEGNGRILRLAAGHSAPSIVEALMARTPKKYFAAAVQEALDKNNPSAAQRIIPLARFADGAKTALHTAFFKQQYDCVLELLSHANWKRDGRYWVEHIDKDTPVEIARAMEQLMGAKTCAKLTPFMWTMAGSNPQAFETFAPHLNLNDIYNIILKKTYTRLTADAQKVVEDLLERRKNSYQSA